jgi:protease secretion system membrane fusion protein
MLKRIKNWLRGPEEALLLANVARDDTSVILADAGQTIRIGLIILFVGLGGFILWAITAPINEGVPAPGMVVLDSKRKTVQHLTGGVVADVLVQEGESVVEGQILIRMRDAEARAIHDSALHSYYSLAAAQARLAAEQRGLGNIVFGVGLANDQHPLAQQHRNAQLQLFQSRRASLHGDLAILGNSVEAADGVAQSAENQQRLINEQLMGIRDLVNEGYAPRNQQLELERQSVDLGGSARRARTQSTEMRLRTIQRTNEFRREVETLLADVARDAAMAKERLQAAREELDRTILKSPSDGQVVGLVTQMSGAVLSPGQRLMDIVPNDEALVLEIHVAPHLIDSVHPGLIADINFNVFANRPQLTVSGRVTSVAGDLLSEQGASGANSYYLARIAVTPEGIKTLGSNRLQPGMPAEVVIKTGERTFFAYLMKPFLRRLQSSIRES